MNEYLVKDSGERAQFASGMVRDTTTGKVMMSLVYDGPMLWRWAEHLTKGAVKYAVRNWMKAAGDEEAERFRDSAARHFAQWMNGERDEDHAAAVMFNINGYEYVKQKSVDNYNKGVTHDKPKDAPIHRYIDRIRPLASDADHEG